MSDPIVASGSQNEKLSTNPIAVQVLKPLAFEGNVSAAQSLEPGDAVSPARSHDGKNRPNSWSWFYSIPFFLSVLIVLGCFGLLPLLMLKPDKCGRFSFGLTLYRVGETRAEYDGQCQREPSGVDLTNPLG